MKKETFISELNQTIPSINLTDDDLVYLSKDTSNLPELSGNIGAAIGRWTEEITITYKEKTKTYQAGDGTTFPCEFIDDYNNGYYK